MQWSAADPGVGDLTGLEHRARQLRERGDHAADMVGLLSKAGMGMAEHWSGDAADVWSERVHDDLRRYSHLNDSAETQSAALLLYVQLVADIKRRVAAARGRLADAQDATAALQREQDTGDARRRSPLDDALDDVLRAQQAVARLAEERREADEGLVRSMRALSHDVRSSAQVSAFDKASVAELAPAAILKRLSRLDGAQVVAVLDEHPELLDHLEEAAPALVASWWASLSPGRQESLVESAPGLIGNLDGVGFIARDAANRLMLASELVRAEADLAASKKHNESVAPAYRWDTSADAATLAALKAVRDAAAGGSAEIPRLILGLDLRRRPQAAVCVGNPDTASQVTVDVPGMGTTVAGSIGSWTSAATNLYYQQKKSNEVFGDNRETGLATVAWIGYDAPDMTPSPQVLGTQSAHEGGARLSRFLDGVSATREWPPGKNLSVVAHSYGTTTAAAALKTTRVESFTMLASAGLEATAVKELKVDSKNVWATLAEGDEIAGIGRGIVTLGHVPVFSLPSAHRTDPTTPRFGAHVFSSEDAVYRGEKLEASDGHSATPQIDALGRGETTSDHGYLDQGTTPLFNASLTSLGLGDVGPVITK